MKKNKEFEKAVNLSFGSLTMLAAIAAHPHATDTLVWDGWKLWRQAAMTAFIDSGYNEEQAAAAINVLVVIRFSETAPERHVAAFHDRLERSCPGIFDHFKAN